LIFDDIWDETALADLPSIVVSSDANYPVLGAQEGFSCATTLPTKVLSLLVDAQPILLPAGQQLSQSVQIVSISHLHALQEVCNLRLSLRWPTSIGFSDFVSSISAAFSKSGDHFISILKALQPPLKLWFTSLATDPSPFVIQGRAFLSF
jgi:hypothetical protein